MYENLAEKYGWTPDQVNDLTLFQLAVYTGAITPEHGRVKLSEDDTKSYLRQLRERKEKGLM